MKSISALFTTYFLSSSEPDGLKGTTHFPASRIAKYPIMYLYVDLAYNPIFILATVFICLLREIL